MSSPNTIRVSVTDNRTLNPHLPVTRGYFAADLPRLMLALDYDGPETLNPRYL